MKTMDKKTRLGFSYRFIPSNTSEAITTTLLLLHGTGGTEEDLIPVGREIAPNAAILSPRGKVLENGMPRFFRRLAEGVFDRGLQPTKKSWSSRYIDKLAKQWTRINFRRD